MYSELLIGCFHTDCEHQATETATHIFFMSRWIFFLKVPTANKRINPSPRWNGMAFTYMNKNGWQANYPRLWAPSLVWQRTSKLTCTDCLADVLKYIQNRPQYSFNSSTRSWNSHSNLGKQDGDIHLSLRDQSKFSLLWNVLSNLFSCVSGTNSYRSIQTFHIFVSFVTHSGV